MRQLSRVIVLISVLQTGAICAFASEPEVQLVDKKLSIHAEAVPLAQLLRLLDKATGMSSQVPAALANRNISVQFSELTLNAGIRKIFEGQRLDYFFIGGKGVIVTAVSQLGAASDQASFPPPPAYTNDQPLNPGESINETFIPPQPPIPQPGFNGSPFQGPVPANPFNTPQQQPAVIQTPFGPIPNPRANPNGQPNDSSPLAVPGQQQNPFGNPAPFGSPNPFGAPGAPPSFGPSTTPFPGTTLQGQPRQP